MTSILQYSNQQLLKKMFDNTPTNIRSYHCPNHPSQNLTHLCLDLRCSSNPYLCPHCSRSTHLSHQQSLVPVTEVGRELAGRIESSRGELKRMYVNTVGGKRENEGLMRKVMMGRGERGGGGVIQGYLRNIREQVEREANTLQTEFLRRIETTKLSIFSQLDTYQRSYNQNLELYRSIIEPLVTFNRKLKHYGNPNNIHMKLLAELKRGAGAQWFVDFKRSLGAAMKTLQEKTIATVDQVNRMTQQIGVMMEEMPVVRVVEGVETRNLRLQNIINDYLSQVVKVKEVRMINVEKPDGLKFATVPMIPSPSNIKQQQRVSDRGSIIDTERSNPAPYFNRTLSEQFQRTNSNSNLLNPNRTILKPGRLI